MEDGVCGFSQPSLMKEAFSLQGIFYAAERKFEGEETIIFFSAPQMICNGMLAKTFHFRTQENGFYWILMGWFKKSPASAGCLQPCNRAYHKVCQYFSYTRAWLCRITCKEDWFVPMLSCTQERQGYSAVPANCAHAWLWMESWLWCSPEPSYKVQEVKFSCKIMFCANYIACKMMVDLWMESGM